MEPTSAAPTPLPVELTLREKLEDTLHILSLTANRNYHLLKNCVQVHIDTQDNPSESEQALIKGVFMFTSIQFSAFLDEWERHFLKLKEDATVAARIEKVERLVKPAFDIIAEYPGIKDLRDTFLAHNSRVRIGRNYINSYRGEWVTNLVTPATLSEFMLVATALLNISQTLIAEFSDYYIEPEEFIKRHTVPNGVKAKSSEECFDLDAKMSAEMEALKHVEDKQ